MPSLNNKKLCEPLEVWFRKQPNRKSNSKNSNDKRSKTLKGRPKSLEWKEKIRQSALRRWSDPEQKCLQSERIKNTKAKRPVMIQNPKGEKNEVYQVDFNTNSSK